MEPFAKAGDAVTDEAGNVICYVKNDLHRHRHLRSDDFERFTEGNEPWKPNQPVDKRVVRAKADGGLQICINGEWRP